MKNRLKPYLPTMILALLCLMMPYGTLKDGMEWYEPFIFHFTHANIWHFSLNALYLAQFKPRWSTVGAAYLIASACGEMAFTGMSVPTCGISGMCFAMQARHDVAWRVLNWRLILINTAMAFFPMFNWKLHLAAYITSFAIWKLIYLQKNRTSRKK